MKTSKDFTFLGLLFFVFTIPLTSFLSVKVLLVLFLGSLIKLIFNRKQLILKRNSWDLVVYFVLLSIGIIYSVNYVIGIKVLETNFGLIAIPFVFLVIKNFKEERLNLVAYAFVIGLIIACIICLANASFHHYQSDNLLFFRSYQLTNIINCHPTYLAYYLIFAITFILYSLYYQKWNVRKEIVTPALLLLFLMLILTGSQTTFIAMLLVLSFFLMKFLIDEKTKERKIVFALACLMVTGIFFTSYALNDNRDLVLTDSWERFVLWESALKANPNFLLGVGTGDYKEILNQYYADHNLVQYAKDSYNSHNQFIQILFTNGILGLIAVVVLIARPIYLSVKYNDVLGTLVFFPFLIYGMTEVFLGRYQGVVFFALLHQLFLSYYASLKPTPVSLKGA